MLHYLVCELPLANSTLTTKVDAKYFSHLNQISNWYLNDISGAVKSGASLVNGKKFFLHRYIMMLEGKLVSELQVDHKDRNKLNNVSNNLRMVTEIENKRNRGKYKNSKSKYIGVSWKESRGKWEAALQHNGVRKYLGRFDSEVEAANAYNLALAAVPIAENFKVYNILVQL